MIEEGIINMLIIIGCAMIMIGSLIALFVYMAIQEERLKSKSKFRQTKLEDFYEIKTYILKKININGKEKNVFNTISAWKLKTETNWRPKK